MGHDQDIDNIKKSIQSLNQLSSDEKKNLLESIEMLWLNASVRKKKSDIDFLVFSTANFRQLQQLPLETVKAFTTES